MGPRVRDLAPDRLDELPEPCRSCVFWEAAAAPPPSGDDVDGRERKRAWWQATHLDWATPGKAAYDAGELIGYATFAPGGLLPRSRRLGGASDDALLLATLWVAPAYRGQGVATALLHAVLRDVRRHRARALEAFAARGGAAASCVVDEGFLLARGFVVQRAHVAFPLLRLDLRRTVWESLSEAVEGAASTLGQRRGRLSAPAPPEARGAARWLPDGRTMANQACGAATARRGVRRPEPAGPS